MRVGGRVGVVIRGVGVACVVGGLRFGHHGVEGEGVSGTGGLVGVKSLLQLGVAVGVWPHERLRGELELGHLLPYISVLL